MRRRKSALHLGGYSIVLLTLALLSVHYHWLQAVAAMVSFLGHEMLIQLDSRQELEAPPRYVPPAEGLMVLDTVVDTPAEKAGIKTGDVLLKLHSMSINTRDQLAEAISLAPAVFILAIVRDGRPMEKKVKFSQGHRMLGVILVPEGNELYYVQLTEDKFWLWEKMKEVWGKKSK
jgi:membrane-associated protease RseP (regulator of RpoE activity)